MAVCVRKAISRKSQKNYYALVLNVNGREYLFMADTNKVCELLNLRPAEVFDLACGDYPLYEAKEK